MLYSKGSALQFFHMKYKKQKERREKCIFPCHASKQEKKKDGMQFLQFKTLSLKNIPETISVFLLR